MCCPIGFGAISGSDPKDRKFDEVSYSLGRIGHEMPCSPSQVVDSKFGKLVVTSSF